jgi:hypothetical protein
MGKVVVFTGPRTVGFESYEDRPLRPREVRLRTLYSGISAGTELTAYRGSNPYQALYPLGTTGAGIPDQRLGLRGGWGSHRTGQRGPACFYRRHHLWDLGTSHLSYCGGRLRS